VIRRITLAMALIALGVVGTLPRTSVSAATSTSPQPKQYYLALGDSITFGYQGARIAAEVQATGTVNPAGFTTGVANDYLRILQVLRPGIQLVNYACPGETSTQFVSVSGCPTFSYQGHAFPLHNAFTGTQLAAALAFIAAHPGQVSPITVDIGANDVVQLLAACGGLSNVTCVASAFPAALKTFGQNLTQILGALRQAAPDASITVLEPYNPYSVAAPSSSILADAVNKVIVQVAAATHVHVADAYTPFNVNPPQPQTICALTAFCTPLHDIHPTVAGYLRLAQTFYDASGFAAVAPGFLVTWTSSTPGQGEVYFGSGPGCSGLVEVATQDVFSNGTQHAIMVSGNDLPGTAGDAGVQPGGTYSYELVTVTRADTQVDNNGGKCYTVMVSKSS